MGERPGHPEWSHDESHQCEFANDKSDPVDDVVRLDPRYHNCSVPSRFEIAVNKVWCGQPRAVAVARAGEVSALDHWSGGRLLHRIK